MSSVAQYDKQPARDQRNTGTILYLVGMTN